MTARSYDGETTSHADRLQFDSRDEAATVALAELLEAQLQRGDVIALAGELGAGKTVFARALIRAALGPGSKNIEVPSPTYTLVQVYETTSIDIWHFDLYRIGHPEEVRELGFEEALAGGTAIIEWPERLGPDLPSDRLELTFEYVGADANARTIGLEGKGSWSTRLAELSEDIAALAVVGPGSG